MDLTELQAAVTENTSVDGSAVTLLNLLADKLEAASGDQAAINQIAASIRASSAALAAAVTANTPAAPEPPATPETPTEQP